MKIHEILRKERRLHEIGQRDLAQRVGISIVTLYRFEKGFGIQLSTLEKICDVLGYEITLTKKENSK